LVQVKNNITLKTNEMDARDIFFYKIIILKNRKANRIFG